VKLEEIEAWQVSLALACDIISVCSAGELSKRFAIRDQMVRSALSVPSNIAEGFERDGNREFIQHLSIAKGSLGELRTQLLVAKRCGFLSDQLFGELNERSIRSSQIVAGFIRYLKKSDHRGTKFK
jgi:four helix bundle protein